MARKHPRPEVSRRKFLTGAAVAGATTALAPPAAKAAATTDASISAPRRPSALPPTMQVAVSATATWMVGGTAEGRRGALTDASVAAAFAAGGASAVVAPATAAPAKNLRRLTSGCGCFRAMGFLP